MFGGLGWQEALISSVFGGCVFLVPIAIVVMLVLILRRLDAISATLSRIEQMNDRRRPPPVLPIARPGEHPTGGSSATRPNE